MSTLVAILHIAVCIFLMLTVLLQSGKSGGMGAAFGGGNASTVFGGSGASSFLQKLTAGAATIFMATSMILSYIASGNAGDALQKFGTDQQSLMKQKEEAKKKALDEAAAAAATGSGSAVAPATTDSTETPNPPPSSNAPSPGAPSTMSTPPGTTLAPATAGSAPLIKTNTPAPAAPAPAPAKSLGKEPIVIPSAADPSKTYNPAPPTAPGSSPAH